MEVGDKCSVRGEPGLVLDKHPEGDMYVHTRRGTYWTDEATPRQEPVEKANTRGITWEMANANKQVVPDKHYYAPMQQLVKER